MAAMDLATPLNPQTSSMAAKPSTSMTPTHHDGYWDEEIVVEKSKLESNLSTVKTELDTLAAKLKASK